MLSKALFGSISKVARLILIVAILLPAAPAQEIGVLRGTLLDPEGAALANVEIELRWNNINNDMHWDRSERVTKRTPPTKRTLKISTNSAGEFSVNLQAGNWDIFAYRDGFAPTCTVVLIESGKTTNISLRFPGRPAMPVQ
jgi:hypothetical protein